MLIWKVSDQDAIPLTSWFVYEGRGKHMPLDCDSLAQKKICLIGQSCHPCVTEFGKWRNIKKKNRLLT